MGQRASCRAGTQVPTLNGDQQTPNVDEINFGVQFELAIGVVEGGDGVCGG
jgi:hypothetical protein